MFKDGKIWPYIISLFLIGSVVASYSTIKTAIANPVQDSNIFLSNYHITDKNINQILSSQIAFNSKYQLDFSDSTFENREFNLSLNILENGLKVESSIEGIITRPETTEFDTRFTGAEVNFQYPKSGRWIIHIKATVKNLTGYFSIEVDNSNSKKVQLFDPFISHKRVEKIEHENQERLKQLLNE